jgi:hypothetical protein
MVKSERSSTTAEKASKLTYTAVCNREGSWWVITVPELESGRVTQARSLDEVPATVADLVATMTGADLASIEVDVKARAGIDTTRLGLAAAVAVAAGVLWRAIRNVGPGR